MLLLFAALLLAGAVLRSLVILRGVARIPALVAPIPGLATERPAPGSDPVPTVAVIVPARNEGATLEPALRRLLESAGPGTSVVVVNDRSTDDTGEIADRLVDGQPRARAVHVAELPPGWLGKNHALARGAQAAPETDYLLFTDADVHFEPGAIEAAVALAEREQLDHLAGAPRVAARGAALQGMIATFGVLFALFTRPWRVADPKSDAFIGIGALNLVRRESYLAAGGHEPIRLRIDDDLGLGELLKRRGGRAAFCFARDVAEVEWYPSLGAMVRGLEKNAFAGVGYRTWFVLLASAALIVLFLGPWLLAALPAATWLERGLLLATGAIQLIGATRAARDAGLDPRAGLLFPLGIVLFLFILWRSTLVALVTRRVRWRGTDYALDELVEAWRSGRP